MAKEMKTLTINNDVYEVVDEAARNNSKPLILSADDANIYDSDSTYGDIALKAILSGKQILIRVPNEDGMNHTAIFSPVLMYQLPNYENNYLYLFYLRDEKQDLSSVLGFDYKVPVYGQLQMRLSETYTECPLK